VSEPHRGSTFAFHFPIGESAYLPDEKGEAYGILSSETESESGEDSAPVVQPVDLTETLLLVEDNPDLLHVLQNHFTKKYKVLTAVNGRLALDVVSENDIQIIVSDIMMPEMDGLELCKTIKGKVETSHIPVLLVTAKNQLEDRIECYNAGADGYIAKPFDLSLLDVRIRNLLTRREFQTNEYKQNPQIILSDLEYNSLDQQFLDMAVRFVEENLGNFELSHDDLLIRLNTTKSTLYRKLKSLTGLSPSEFIKNIRIKHACRMLQQDSGNISDIAYSVGFNDPKYFSTCFKAEMGMTPREYAKSFRENEPE
jgi:DNA-binding response OmpR family regulator